MIIGVGFPTPTLAHRSECGEDEYAGKIDRLVALEAAHEKTT